MFWTGHEYVLEDLGSANGVFYQEQRVNRHAFKHGDAVRCGSLWLRYVDMNQGQRPGAGSQSTPVPHLMNREPQSSSHHNPHHNPHQPATPVYRPPAHAHTPHQPAHMPHTPMPTPPGPTPSTPPTPMGPSPEQKARAEADAEQIKRLKRRVEQLQTELRLYRGGRGAEVAKRLEELENENDELQGELQRQKTQLREMKGDLEASSVDVRAKRADQLAVKTAETVQQLNDILSNLRINVMAAEGEFEQFSHELPRASFELIREALRSSSGDVDTARTILRQLRDLAD